MLHRLEAQRGGNRDELDANARKAVASRSLPQQSASSESVTVVSERHYLP